MSGEVLSGLTSVGFETDGAGGGTCISTRDGVGVFCALRACIAFRRYSDLGATEPEPVRLMDGRVWSGVDGRCELLRAEPRDEGEEEDMSVVVRCHWVRMI